MNKKEKINSWDWRMGVVLGLVVLGVLFGIRQLFSSSQIWGHNYRYNLVMASREGGVRFVSYDPQERKSLSIYWPAELSIKSRSVGSYQIGDLYELGSYAGMPGEMVRRKVQGFMKIPIIGYLESEQERGVASGLWRAIWKGKKSSNIPRLDAVILLWRNTVYEAKEAEIEELSRAGVLVEGQENEYDYQPGRLQQYLGKRVFDWGVGEVQMTVAIVNESGLTGLATDVASFLTNVGMDVIAVRSGEKEEELTRLSWGQIDPQKQERVEEMLSGWFGWEQIAQEGAEGYRAELVIRLGKDAATLF